MATYKKKGYKPKDKKEQQALDMQSTTAEVFNTLDDTSVKLGAIQLIRALGAHSEAMALVIPSIAPFDALTVA